MSDQALREKVIGHISDCVKNADRQVNHNWVFVLTDILRDALALLKAQEPKAVHVTAEINYRKIGNCPNCGKPINSGDYPNYCGHCGQAVKWE